MKTSKSVLLMLATLLIGISLITGGCSTAAKKPVPTPSAPAPSTPMPTAPTTPNVTTPVQPSVMDVANKATMEANKVPGVKNATAVVADKVIYIGLELNSNMSKTQMATTEKNVMDRVMKMMTGYTVKVTSDTKIVAAIKTVAMGITQGKSITDFKNEMNMITMKMTAKPK